VYAVYIYTTGGEVWNILPHHAGAHFASDGKD
jgi:hypothetical protein